MRLVDEYLLLPRPGIVGLIGRQMFAHGQAVHPSLVVPEYYRKSYAEGSFFHNVKTKVKCHEEYYAGYNK